MTVFVRSASRRDLEAVSNLLSATWHSTYDDIYGAARVAEITAEWHSTAQLAENLARPNSEFVLAEGENGLVGMAYASMVAERVLMLHQLYIHPDCQRQGAGELLLAEICECFPQAGAIRLEVEEENSAAVVFYRRHGFIDAGATENCGKADSGIAALVMEKPLA